MFMIIIPVYNVGKKCIFDCLNSLVSNKKYIRKILLINDCSNFWDEELSIINDFKNKLDITILINKNNIGLGPTRNVGIQYLKDNWSGEYNKDYILFLDSDDQFIKNSLKKLNKKIKKFSYPDLLRFSFVYQKNNKIFFDYKFPFFNEKFKDNCFLETSWLAAYKLNYIISKNLFFFNSRKHHEDVYYSLITSSLTKSICSTNLLVYLYRVDRTNSITSKWNINNVDKKDKINWINSVSFYIKSAFSFLINSEIDNQYFNNSRFYFQKFSHILNDERLEKIDINEYINSYNDLIDVFKKLNIWYIDTNNECINTDNLIKSDIKYKNMKIFINKIYVFLNYCFLNKL